MINYSISTKYNIVHLIRCLVFFIAVLFCSCNKIETENSLSKADKDYINSIISLDKDEMIYRFYSESKLKTMGNFYTNKRIVEYYIRPDDTSRNKIHSAFYEDITSIDTVYDAGLTYCPYLSITQVKGDTMEEFHVCFEGDKPELKVTFEEAIKLWKRHKKYNKLPNVPK